jgi:predicted nucleic acid-binding protein
MSDLVLFDTSVLIDHFRTNGHAGRLSALTAIVQNSSVVLSELWRGIRTREEAEFMEVFQRQHPVLVPGEEDWLLSGKILLEIRKIKGFEAGKLRDLHFDVLIALTARAHGARLITSTRDDFELIRQCCDFQLEVW